MLKRDGYPAGVPCRIDVVQPDMAAYGGLFGWEFEIRTPAAGAEPSGWTTYVWVDSADDTAATVLAAGGQVLTPAADIPGAGRLAMCADPSGAVFGLT